MNRKKILFYFATLVLIIALCVSCSKEDKLMTEPEASLSSQKAQTFEISNYESWDVGESYVKGDTVLYKEKIYKCLQSHTANANSWNPSQATSLWEYLDDHDGSKPMKQYKTWQKGRNFEIGDKVVYKNKVYSCRQAHTAHSAGWTPSSTPALWTYVKDWSGPQIWREGVTYSNGDIVFPAGDDKELIRDKQFKRYMKLKGYKRLKGYKCLKKHTSNSSNKPPSS